MKALCLIGLLGLSASVQTAPAATERSAVHAGFADLPLTFEVNHGQTDRQVDFLARGPGYTVFLTPTEAVFALARPNGAPTPARTVVRMRLVGSALDSRVHGMEKLPGKVNYFRGNDSSKWRANVRTYKRVKYTAVYPGVDLDYYGRPQQLEYDFIVAPGADPSAIKLAFAGADATTVDARGDLVLTTAGGPLRFEKPIIYQLESGRRHSVDGGYVQISPREIGFQVGTYDRTRPLVIDPVLSYSTYLGGNSGDSGLGIAVDATGAVYVAGTTGSADFPTVNALQLAHGGGVDAFVVKLTPDGTALIYATYVGGRNDDIARAIAVDSAGNAHITGSTTSPDFPTARALQATLNGERDDAFVAQLSAEGSALIYSTFLGGRDFDIGRAIAVDLSGAAYVTGGTLSIDFPTVNAFLAECMNTGGGGNAFVSKLTPEGTALAYSTYLGGSSRDSGVDIAVDSVGAAHVTGHTDSADFPTVSPIRPYRGTGADAFVAKLAPDGKSLIYSTHLGGSGHDEGRGIAADVSGAAYVTGEADSSDFPTVNALQPVPGGLFEGFVAKLPPEGGTLMYATYLGGSGDDILTEIAVDTAGAAYVTGDTTSSDFPTMNPLQPAFGGGADAFVAKLSPNGATLLHATYLGGSDFDGGSDIAVDLTGAVYVTGATESADFPTAQPLQATRLGRFDAFVAKITDDSLSAAPGNDSGSGEQRGDDSGGGLIDALLAVLLAQLAFASALRRTACLAGRTH